KRKLRQPGHIVDAELLHHRLPVTAYGLQAEIQHDGDILAGLALGHQAQDLELARRERFQRAAIVRVQVAALYALQQSVGNLRTEVAAAAGDGAQGVQQFGRRRLLEHEGAGAGADGAHHRVLIVVHGENHDLDAGAVAQQLGGRLDAVHARQPDIHQYQVGRGLPAELHGVGAVFGLARPALQYGSHPIAYQLMIIDKHNVERHSYLSADPGVAARTVVPVSRVLVIT